MKKLAIFSIVLAAVAALSMTSCKKDQPRLASPQLTVSGIGSDWFTVAWQPVDGAARYICSLNDGASETTVNECSVTFSEMATGTYTVLVRAAGDGYLDSEASEITVNLEDASLAMALEYAGEAGKFDISFTPSGDVTEIKYAVTSAVQKSLEEYKAAFEDGTLEGIATLTAGTDNSVSVARDSIGPYFVFAKGITSSGIESETVSSQIMAAPAGFTVDAYDLVAMDITSTIYDDSQAYSGLLVVSKSVLQELGMSIEELLEMYAMYGMVPYTAAGTSMTVALNGYEDYDYIMGVVGFDASGMPVSYGSFSFKSGFADASLPLPSPLVIEAYNVGDTEASVKYTMGENTRAYYQMIVTLDGYNTLLEAGAGIEDYDKPEDYVRDYAAVYGTTMFTDDDYVWQGLDPGTDYVALGFPMNGNGSLGYGEMTATEFSTTGTASSAAATTGLMSTASGKKVFRPVTLESARKFLDSVR